MIIHIVIFKLIENDIKSVNTIKKELIKLKDLPYLLHFDLIEKSNILNSYIKDGDLILFSKFKTKDDLCLYMTDQKHLEVIKKTSNNIQEKYTLDFNSK
ncbi:Dabb family protein [Aquimarina longa]|uniref:Dabb family protein n=1 Tax=Aquimarina longa TaxID=1080221 RepID=UPI000782C05B|nr:Dabb family protein [Aquimarina longa]